MIKPNENTTSNFNITRDDCVRSLRDAAKLLGVSIATLRRMIASGEAPIVTRLSERRLGIRDSHRLAWLDARTCKRSAA